MILMVAVTVIIVIATALHCCLQEGAQDDYVYIYIYI